MLLNTVLDFCLTIYTTSLVKTYMLDRTSAKTHAHSPQAHTRTQSYAYICTQEQINMRSTLLLTRIHILMHTLAGTHSFTH